MTLLERIGPWAQAIVSVLIMACFMGTLAGLFMTEADFPEGVREVVLVLVGVLAGAFKDVVGYWIGSSYGSAKKTDQMARTDLTP